MLLWGNRDDLRRALDDARARMAGLEAQLADRGRVDETTGLLTRESFRGDAEAVLAHAAQAEQPLALVLVDIDGFRALNERLGPEAADAALAAVAGRLQNVTRGSDVLGRTGADEFAVLMPGTTLDGARVCCERLIAQLERTDRVTVSAGMAALRPDTTLDGLLAAAGRGVDRARRDGGSRAELPTGDAPDEAPDAQRVIIDALATTLVERDRYTGEHAEVVVGLARAVATELGLDDDEAERIAHGALLHDIGKVGVPDRVLHKPGPLDPGEWVLMREHPVIGERILRAVPGLAAIARMVRHEHERFDGTGYPDGLAGEDIPLGSRVILACDAYHAMTSHRPYRRALPDEHAISELIRCAGSQFDPRVVSALVGVLRSR